MFYRRVAITMKVLFVLAAISLSTPALAQGGSVGGKPLAQVKPKEPMGCKLVGTVRGTKLWAGDCISPTDQRAAAPATETQPLTERATGVIPPGQTQ
jgi:hypothetical protein